jgi:hypothetical protein
MRLTLEAPSVAGVRQLGRHRALQHRVLGAPAHDPAPLRHQHQGPGPRECDNTPVRDKNLVISVSVVCQRVPSIFGSRGIARRDNPMKRGGMTLVCAV